jgi:NAD-dependent deacetylase
VTLLADVAERLRAATRIAVLTGAGMSAESGIPTFREAQTGLWEKFRAEELASPEAFARDPLTVWEWYRWRRGLIDGAKPNEGHKAVAALQRHKPGTIVVTQNVDGLHQAAGTRNVVELHGSIHHARCSSCGSMRPWEPDEPVFPPICARCGAMLRPHIVWFGENLPATALEQAFEAADSCDVFLSIGTSNLVQPAAALPWLAATRHAFVAVVNVSMDGQREADNVVHLTGKAGEVLPRLVQLAFEDGR